MRWHGLLLAALSVNLAPVLSAQEMDRQKLQGTWVCDGSLQNGKDAPKYRGIRAVIEDNHLTWHYPRKDGSYLVRGGRYVIDPSQQPKQFDWWYHESPELVDRRLYTVTDDTLRWSTNLDHKTTKTRPASFEAGRFQFTMKRDQPPMLGTAIDPDGDCTLQLSDNKLEVKLPARGHDLWYGSKRFNAPRMVRSVSGDFTAQVKVTADWQEAGTPSANNYNYIGAGLLIWQSETQYLRLERNRYMPPKSKPVSYTNPLYDLNNHRVEKPKLKWSADFFQGGSTWLRLERTGQRITAAISHDGTNWSETGALTTEFPPRVQLGVHAINSSTTSEFAVKFSDLVIRKR